MNQWIFFSLLAPFFWALGNVLDGELRKNFIKNDLALTVLLAFMRLPLLIVFFAVFGLQLSNSAAVLWIIVGGILWMAPFLLYYAALDFEEPSRVALLIQMVNITTLIFAFLLINERLTSMQYAAFSMLLVGGIFAALKKMKSNWRFSRAFWLIGIASAAWSLSDIIFKKFQPAFENFGAAFSFYLLGSFLPAAALFFLSFKNRSVTNEFKGLPKRAWIIILFDQVANLTGTTLFAYALTLGKASLTTVMLGIQPLFVIGWGLILSKVGGLASMENFNRKNLAIKFASFCLIMAGLLLL